MSFRHGRRARVGLSGREQFGEALRVRRESVAADLGGEAELSEARRVLVDRLVELSAIAEWQVANIARHGVLSTKGRQRAVVGAYLGVCDRLVRVAVAVGLERQPRHVDLGDYLRTAYGNRASAPQGAREAAQASVTGAAGDRGSGAAPAAAEGDA